jgi:hypothetical protein
MKFKKIVFLVFGSNHRYSTFGNFGKTQIYENILLISLGGRLKSIIGRILYLLRIGKFIGVDANPLFKNEKNSINWWLNGTQKMDIKELENHKSSYFNMSNPILSENPKIIQIYPIIYKKKKFLKKPKIIFMGSCKYKPNENLINYNFLEENKEKFLEKFDIVDSKSFWLNDKDQLNKNLIYKKYRVAKCYLRQQIIFEIKKRFKDNFIIYGEDKINTGINFRNPTWNPKYIKKIYEGNICLDPGSSMGSLSLHPRALNILESNGLLIQAKQVDAVEIWGALNEKIIFNNIENLLNGIDIILNNQYLFNEYLDILYEMFFKSKLKLNKELKRALNL